MKKLLLALLLCVSASASAEDLYVRPAGGSYGAADGLSYATAFNGLANVQYATVDTAGKVDAADTIHVCGAFNGEKLAMTTATGEGAAGSPITIDCRCAAQRDPATILETGTQAQGILLGAGVDYVIVDGCRVSGPTNGSGDPEASIASLDGTNITLLGVEAVNNSAATGVRMRKCQTCVLDRVISHDNKNHGIAIIGDAGRNTTDILINAPVAYGNLRTGVLVTGATTAADAQRIVVQDPVAYGNGDGLYMKWATNVTFKGTYDGGCVVRDNTLTTDALAEGYGVGHQQAVNGTTTRCRITGNRSDGIEVWGDATIPSTGAVVSFNYIANHTNPLADMTPGNGFECRTGYATCLAYGNIFVNNQRNARIGPSALGASYLVNNIMVGGIDSIHGVVGNAPSYNASPITGWTIANNVLYSPASNWLITDVAAGNANVVAGNAYFGSGAAVYNNVAYAASSIITVDPQRLVGADLKLRGSATSSAIEDFMPRTNSPLKAKGVCYLSVGCIYPDPRGYRAKGVPPNIGVYQR